MCADAERTPAFWPWTAALRGLLRALDPGEAHAVTRTDANELARLLPELADQATEPAAQELSDDPRGIEVARLRLFDAVTRFLQRLASQQATAVVLDDLQWADESSLQLLKFVARPYRPVPLVIIGAYRHDELTTGIAQSLADLTARGESLLLPGLGPQDLHDLVADAFGATTADRWAGEIHRRTGGHPFFARQLAAPRRRRATGDGAVSGARPTGQAGATADPGLSGTCAGRRGGRRRAAARRARRGLWHRASGPRNADRGGSAGRDPGHLAARGTPVVAADLARHCAAAVTLDGASRAVR